MVRRRKFEGKRQKSKIGKRAKMRSMMMRKRNCEGGEGLILLSPFCLCNFALPPSESRTFALNFFYGIQQHWIWCRHRTDPASINFLEGIIGKDLVVNTEIAQLLQWRKHLATLRFLATGKYNYALETTWVCCNLPFLGQLLSLLESFFSMKLCSVY